MIILGLHQNKHVCVKKMALPCPSLVLEANISVFKKNTNNLYFYQAIGRTFVLLPYAITS